METPQSSASYRVSIVVALLIVALVGGWFAFYNLRTQPAVDEALSEQFSWRLVDSEDNKTVVSLRVANVPVMVGVYEGECQNPPSLLSGELSGILCLTGESGVEIGVFKEEGNLVLKEGIVDPSTGRGASFTPIVR